MIESLTRQGINTYLLSGDKRSAAEYVASAVGIPKTRVRLLLKISFLVAHILPTLGRIVDVIYRTWSLYQILVKSEKYSLKSESLIFKLDEHCYLKCT